jgi:DNA polymerase III delta prime subunit
MSTVNKLFTEIFRPTELKNVVLLPRIYNELSKGLTQNIILYGSAGGGKTTLTRILSKGYDTLTINCSEERGIDIIREKIIGFSSSISLLGGKEQIKVIDGTRDEGIGITEEILWAETTYPKEKKKQGRANKRDEDRKTSAQSEIVLPAVGKRGIIGLITKSRR